LTTYSSSSSLLCSSKSKTR